MNSIQMKTILHCDANSFYASVEKVLNPSLRNLPIAVCGDIKKRHGIVLAKSEEAKKCGVFTGENIGDAIKKCPDLVLIPPNYISYVNYSKLLRSIYLKYTSLVESFGIDECWLDITSLVNIENTPYSIAKKISEEVKTITGLTISIGISFNKIFAKIGSDYKKPDAITEINYSNYKEIVYPLDVSSMLYIGSATKKILNKLNIYTIGDLANADPSLLKYYLGSNGEMLYKFSLGEADDCVMSNDVENDPKSIGNGTTLPSDIVTTEQIRQVVYSISQIVSYRLRKKKSMAYGVALSIRLNDLSFRVKRYKAFSPFNTINKISELALDLIEDIYQPNVDLPIRAITINVFSIVSDNEPIQASLFDDDLQEKESKLENEIFKINKKYGKSMVKKAITNNVHLEGLNNRIKDGFTPFNIDKDD